MSPLDKKMAVATRDAEATKIRILDAAEEEFAKGGLLGARTEAIAGKTDVTKCMMFYYFKSKEGLYQAVLERAVGRHIEALKKIDIQNTKPEDALRSLIAAFLEAAEHNQNLPRIFFYEGIQNKGKYYGQLATTSIYMQIVAVLEKGMAAGKFRKMDAMHTAVNIIGMCVFYYCHFENLKYLWPSGTDLLSRKMKDKHNDQTIEQIMASVMK
jgi:AcrR family transcriptional regulator